MGRKAIVKLLKRYKENISKDIPIERMLLFGSYAEGKAHPDSDVDLLVVSPSFRRMNFFKRGAKMYDHWDTRHPVDFLCYTPEEFQKLREESPIVREAEREGIEI
ncbi:MAG: nucleotidyltransferase domain-containing protein [Candidatus Tectomicrobia bacterium]|uniref:Nucleotidyltransferase domain-containing protein n=1 Tax=Tectimicrobiota bacterium TaxID=2528274 RepID=A0A932I280_UNCTE|nr:nucleotidyltransferase domain-containing protein [Candidatus Tectomicrobia bacterium]